MLVQSNKQFPVTPSARIPLQHNFYSIVDPGWFDRLIWLPWYAKKSFHRYYACMKVTEAGRVWFVRMHRLVANTPDDMICHHVNGNTFDNREANLLNMTWYDHTKLHSYR